MEKYDTDHLKKTILIIANEVKRICEKNKINYGLSSGSLLGAVRHKGFIPWDDDFDIDMTRENYEKFIIACRNDLGDDFFLQTCETDEYYPYGYCKVLLKGTRAIQLSSANTKYQNGIFVDIFPWDNVSDNILAKHIQMFIVYVCTKILMLKSGAIIIAKTGIAKRIVFYIIGVFEKIFPRKNLIKLRDIFLKKYSSATKKVACMVGKASYKKTEIKRDMFDQYTILPFENTSFSAILGYDHLLTRLYGDYMQIPPVDQQVTHDFIEVDFGKY